MKRLFCTVLDLGMLAWTVLGFLGIQLVLNVFLEIRHPEIYDPEYRDRLLVLQQCMTDEPDRPLLLVTGSSRIITDFRPETLPLLKSSAGEQPLPINFSHAGAGPLMTLMEVRRLLRLGIHPTWMVVEVVPPMLGVSGQSTAASLAQASDLPVLRRHMNPGKLYGWYAWERLRICGKHQDACVRSLAPWMMTQIPEWDTMPLEPLGGSVKYTEVEMTSAEIRRRTEVVRAQYQPGLQRFRIGETSNKALRELLDLAREKKIEIVLLLAPESSEFRSWYAPEALAEINRYCQALTKEYSVPLVDARAWLSDNAFSDGHHATPEAAVDFTSRLGKEVLEPLVEGRMHAHGGSAFVLRP